MMARSNNIFFEYIEGDTLLDLLQNNKFDQSQTVGVLLQIFHGFALAWDRFRFTHYDLHGQNIMINDKPRHYRLMLDNKTIEFDCRYQVKVVDFGFSYMFWNNDNYGCTTSDYHDINIHDHIDNPAYDIYRLLLCIAHCHMKNAVPSVAAELFEEYFQESSQERIETYHSNRKNAVIDYLHLPLGQHRDKDYHSFVDFLCKKIDV